MKYIFTRLSHTKLSKDFRYFLEIISLVPGILQLSVLISLINVQLFLLLRFLNFDLLILFCLNKKNSVIFLYLGNQSTFSVTLQPIFNQCSTSIPPWKHQKTSGVFRGYRSGTLVENGLIVVNWTPGKIQKYRSIMLTVTVRNFCLNVRRNLLK